MEKQGYIFDYGGTLDTGGCHWGKVLWHAYQRHHVPVSEGQFREAYVYAERTLGKNPIIQPDFTFRQTLEAKVRIEMQWLGVEGYQEAVVNDLYELTRGETRKSREVLLNLKRRYPMVLVSNFYGNIGVVLQEFGLDGIFLHVIESAVVGVRKPNPRIFTLGVEALGLPSSAVTVVGDSIDKDIVPARQAGCRTVWLEGEGWTDEQVDRSQADRVIKELKELIV